MFFYFHSVRRWAGVCTVGIFTEMVIVLHPKFLLCVSDFKQNWNSSTISYKIHQYQIP